MPQPSQSATQTPASILDIISYGYKCAIKSLGPLSKLTWPFIILLGIGNGLLISIISPEGRFQRQAMLGALGVLPFIAVVSWYLHYCVARYVRDVFWEAPASNLFSYLLPHRSLLGAIALVLLITVALIPYSIVGIIGIVLLVVPGIVAYTYFYMGSSLMLVAYLKSPPEGVFKAITGTLGLLKRNFWRTIALGLLNFIIICILTSPMSFFSGTLDLVSKMNPSFTHSLPGYILRVSLYSVTVWFSLCIGYVGLVFILNRYLADLQARAQGGDLPVAPELAFTPAKTGDIPIGLSAIRVAETDEQI